MLTFLSAPSHHLRSYNALVVHAIAERGAPTDTLGRLSFFVDSAYIIGGMRMSAQDIEDGVLRGNSPSAASIVSRALCIRAA